MPFKPKEINREHVLNAIRVIEDQKIELIPSTRWLVEINGKLYPPKEVMRYAHEQMNGQMIWDYGGGPPTNKFLSKLGFTITSIDMDKNDFQGVIDEVREVLQRNSDFADYFKFQRVKGGPKDGYYVWIGDKYDQIGVQLAHYEISYGKVPGTYTVDLHFESDNKADLQPFKSVTNKLKAPLLKFPWRGGESVRHGATVEESEGELAKKLSEQLIELEKNLGSDVRKILSKQIDTQSMNNNMHLNQILFGPPGTGKTYKLQTEYFAKFTQANKSQSKEEYIAQVISELSWWEVIALVLLEGEATVPRIKEHPYLKAKLLVSNTKSLNQTVWGQLSSHTIEASTTVKYAKRFEPLFFDKRNDSTWYIVEDMKDAIKDLNTIKEGIDNYKESIVKSDNFKFTTFHQSMSYEDFIEGIKPVLNEENDDGNVRYSLEKGIFYRCCDESAKLAGFINLKDCIHNHSKEERKEKFKNAPAYALFIDEINRGDVSQILGELITLIEEDKRLSKNEILAELPYSKDMFGVPPNLYIIGTMNTADRSVEALDTALRRRFSFIEMPPNPNLEELQYEIGGTTAGEILGCINARIEKLLDKDHQIGHSFFIKKENESAQERMLNAFTKSIIPLLQEYFYGDYAKIGLVLGAGFVRKKEWMNKEVAFADFNLDNTADFDEREVFEILQFTDLSTTHKVNLGNKSSNNSKHINFENALRLLMNQNID